jgi:hypothetical protein
MRPTWRATASRTCARTPSPVWPQVHAWRRSLSAIPRRAIARSPRVPMVASHAVRRRAAKRMASAVPAIPYPVVGMRIVPQHPRCNIATPQVSAGTGAAMTATAMPPLWRSAMAFTSAQFPAAARHHPGELAAERTRNHAQVTRTAAPGTPAHRSATSVERHVARVARPVRRRGTGARHLAPIAWIGRQRLCAHNAKCVTRSRGQILQLAHGRVVRCPLSGRRPCELGLV